MPPGDYAQEKALKQEEKLISQLECLELTNDLIKVLRDQVLWLLDGQFLQTVQHCSHLLLIHLHVHGLLMKLVFASISRISLWY